MKVCLGPILSGLLVAGVVAAALSPPLAQIAPPSANTLIASPTPGDGEVHAVEVQTPASAATPADFGMQKPNLSPVTVVPGPTISSKLAPPALPEGTELHVIGVYEGTTPPGADASPWWSKCTGEYADPIKCHRTYASSHLEKQVEVNVSRIGHPIVLALMAYEPTQWRISLSTSASIERVVLAGYRTQHISGLPPGTPIETYTHEASNCVDCWQGSGYFHAYSLSGGEEGNRYRLAAARLQEITGIRPTTFQGSYRGQTFSVSKHMRELSYAD